MTAGHVVSVETLMLRVGTDNRWSYRHATTSPRAGETPDEAARRLAGVRGDDPGVVLHSTSWRYEPDGRVVLTYAVCPDPAPWLPAEHAPDLEIARGAGPATPSPDHVTLANVVAHAVRHLAFLVAEDPVVARALARHPRLGAALSGPPAAAPEPAAAGA
ncbi:hypothetical protein Nocox_24930 [Nonomuraea coxensis DSM 45129]|uniref:Uncharacterized protein n=1 Tax=Nonomuraea coxensis DSM 45129 TaxID=1122611 RepID=A0ABX8U4J2_9ACTN|nr:hypothetical protein [Nonomuraea coxensis]QYC42589.1 hypothetical protein Nocox_24930 [Nonomuraea coxensis DSM 45129]